VKSHHRFRLDRENGKILGVCAGLAAHFDIDVILVRIAAALIVVTTFPAGLLGYLVLALIAAGEGKQRRRERQRVPVPTASATEARARLRDLDERMQAIESEIVGSRNSALAREIDALR
jgi:phage shock protein C